jgi:hypothetical protein
MLPARRPYELRESVSLAFITALQLLPARQRAALVLRDVLGFRAAEAASILGTTEESVTSALKRARATLSHQPSSDVAEPPAPNSAAEAEIVDRLTRAWEAADIDGVIALLRDDVWLTMPRCRWSTRAGTWRPHSSVRSPSAGAAAISSCRRALTALPHSACTSTARTAVTPTPSACWSSRWPAGGSLP